MPRATRLRFRMPVKLVTRAKRPLPNFVRQRLSGSSQPLLYNAKRLIPTSHGLPQEHRNSYLRFEDGSWRQVVSQDVADFVDDMEAQGTKLTRKEQISLLRSPSKYFSKQQNVPKSLRQQVYFPNFFISLRRNQFLGPNYAQFRVPLNFSKLELKFYLKEVYDVDVVHVRSYVTTTHIRRAKQKSRYTRPARFRDKPKKRMTVQLVKPFVWPVLPHKIDRSLFEQQTYYKVNRAAVQDQQERMFFAPGSYNHVDRVHRKAIAEQAKLMHEGKAAWNPTWQLFDSTRREFTGREQIPSETVDQKSLPPAPPA